MANPQSDRSRWTMLALITLSHVIGATGQYGINTLAPFYQDDLQLSRAEIGLFFTAFYIGMAALSYASGWLADRSACAQRRSAATGAGLCTVAAAFVRRSAGPSAFFSSPVGYSFLNPASTKGVMEWFSRAERATAMGIKQTGVPAAAFSTAVLAPTLVLARRLARLFRGTRAVNLIFGSRLVSLARAAGRRELSGGAAVASPNGHRA